MFWCNVKDVPTLRLHEHRRREIDGGTSGQRCDMTKNLCRKLSMSLRRQSSFQSWVAEQLSPGVFTSSPVYTEDSSSGLLLNSSVNFLFYLAYGSAFRERIGKMLGF